MRMFARKRAEHGRPIAFYVVSVVTALLVLVAALGLMAFIDQKLKQSAEQQVVTFTQQAANSVAYRRSIVQSAITSFEIQSTNPAEVVPALRSMCENFGFTNVAFATMDGNGLCADNSPFCTSELRQPETALSKGQPSSSLTFELEGEQIRLIQRAVYLNNEQVGALYVQLPLSLFALPLQQNSFDGRGTFILFQAASGEVLAAPSQKAVTPLSEGMSIYDFLVEASNDETISQPGGESSQPFFSRQATQIDVAALQALVGENKSGLVTGIIDGKDSYVSIAPVDDGYWYVCEVIPVENVRAEASAVLTVFQMVFGIVLVCFAAVLALMLSSYRKRLRERNVAMKSRLYNAMSDSIDMAVNLYCPADGVVTPIVAKAAHILGLSMPEIMSHKSIADELALSEEGRQLLDLLHNNKVEMLMHGEFSFTNKRTGKVGWVAYSANPLTYEEKQQILVVFHDVTIEKQLQLSMKDAMTAADAANHAKSEFLSRMSHEIRTPMNAIIGMLQIAKLHAGNEKKTLESLGKIAAASGHLLNLINDVLDISKIESGKMVLNSAPFRLSSLVEHAVTVIRPQCEQRSQTLSVVNPAHDEIFVGDDVRLRQLLINLMTNAVKYTPEAGQIRLEVAMRKDSITAYRSVTFVVSDNGIGMTEDFKKRLFEPFVMEGRSNAQGTGLGMPIVKNIVALMGGNIQVDTSVDRGTTFTVELSLRVAFEPERRVLEAAERDGEAWDKAFDRSGRPVSSLLSEKTDIAFDGLFSASMRTPSTKTHDTSLGQKSRRSSAPALHDSASAPPVSLEGAKVLLAEDNDLNAEIARELLEAAGLEVEWAENGQVACDMFSASALQYYDVVLMDVQMPLLDGYQATRCIRALPREDAAQVPIIAMSANAFSEDVHASLDSGMNAHLSKPIDMRLVLSTIAAHVSTYRAQNTGDSSTESSSEA